MEVEAATDRNSIASDEEADCQSNSIAADKEIAADEETNCQSNSVAADEETNSQSNSIAADEKIAADEEIAADKEIAADEETDPQPSLNTLALMRKATTPADISSIAIQDWCSVLFKGVLLENNTQKFWVDEKLKKNCFLVLPKSCDIDWSKKGSCLSIDLSQKESCLSWITKKEKWFSFPSAVDIHVIKLKKLSWLLIEGRFKTRALSPDTTYEVAFLVKLIGTDHEWQDPVELELVLPDETKQTRTEDLKQKPKKKWIDLPAGEFEMDSSTVGTIYFALHETFDPQKSGLIFRGVLIHPKEAKKFDAEEEGSSG